jgi:hypothetical protein
VRPAWFCRTVLAIRVSCRRGEHTHRKAPRLPGSPSAAGKAGHACDLPNIHAFTRGLDLDIDAVIAAVTLPFHSGDRGRSV